MKTTAEAGADAAQELLHYGVKGMKWGVRNDRSAAKAPQPIDYKQEPGKSVVTRGGKNLPATEDAINSAISRQKARASTTDALTTKELQDLVKRMNLEQQYSDLMQKRAARSPNPINRGKNFVKGMLGFGNTANQVIGFKNSPAGKMIEQELNNRRARDE